MKLSAPKPEPARPGPAARPVAAQAGRPSLPDLGARQPATPEAPNQRQGPDPVNPIVSGGVGKSPDLQLESPTNEGTYTSHYLMIMLGASYYF